MLKFNNYKPKYLQISDGNIIDNDKIHVNSDNNPNKSDIATNTDFSNTDNFSAQSPSSQPSDMDQERKNYEDIVDNTNYNNESLSQSDEQEKIPQKQTDRNVISPKAKKYMQFSKLHDEKVREILRKNNQKY